MTRRYVIGGIVALVIGALVVAGILALGPRLPLMIDGPRGPDSENTPADTVGPTQTAAPATSTQSVEKEVLEAFERGISTSGLPLGRNEKLIATDVQIQGDWAMIEATLVDKNTGERFVGEGTIILLRRLTAQWEAAFPGSEPYDVWLDEVPESLVPADLKILLR